jgi:citrate lyase subunit beta/citryl-CoA lyase
VIHPRHVDVVNAAFMPTAEEITWSERVVAAFAGNPSGVVKMDGKRSGEDLGDAGKVAGSLR